MVPKALMVMMLMLMLFSAKERVKKKTNQQGEQQAGTEVRKNNNVHGWRKSATGQGKGTTAVRAAMPGAFKSFFFCVCM
jgi:hypothetical protein